MDLLVFLLVVVAVSWFAVGRPLLRDVRRDLARKDAVQRIRHEADEATRTIHQITQSAQAAILRGLVERRSNR